VVALTVVSSAASSKPVVEEQQALVELNDVAYFQAYPFHVALEALEVLIQLQLALDQSSPFLRLAKVL
jgi:hypothetical protein